MYDLSQLSSFIPFLIPLFILQLVLLVWSIIDIIKRDSFKFGNRIMWIIICLCINVIGPIIYFTLGRGEKSDD